MRYKPSRYIKHVLRQACKNQVRRLEQAGGELLSIICRLQKYIAKQCMCLSHTLRSLWEECLLQNYLQARKVTLARTLTSFRPLTAVLCLLIVPTLLGFALIFMDSPLQASIPTHLARFDLILADLPEKHPNIPAEQQINIRKYRGGAGWYTLTETDFKEKTVLDHETTKSQVQSPTKHKTLLSIKNGQPVIQIATGEQIIPRMGSLLVQADRTPIKTGELERIATGEQSLEMMLADLSTGVPASYISNQYSKPPKALFSGLIKGHYGTDAFSSHDPYWVQSLRNNIAQESFGLQCRLDRVETATWLALLHEKNRQISPHTAKGASQYRQYVEQYSAHYALPPSLIYAIMHVESSFNPIAVSSANALGLMQVVPQTAGGEVHEFLTGRYAIPAPEILFSPESNIRYGTAYLYLLNSRHFKDVKNPISREMCIIAAYNGGPNAVLRMFDRQDKAKAIEKINKLNSDDLYKQLSEAHPYQETREYVIKVLRARSVFLNSAASF